MGLIGPNGIGKSTLIKLILGEIAPDAGKVRRGSRVSVAYYDQFRTRLDEEATVAETIAPGSDYVEIDGARRHVMTYLGDFLFPPERARAPVKALSGGERNRLLLARLFSQPANLMVLDEPTNDLDIDTLELLENLLQDYRGTVLLVSHDRVFLDNVITDYIAAEGGGRWSKNPGGYADWKRIADDRVVAARAQIVQPAPARGRAGTARARKVSFAEAKELQTLPARIEALEREQVDIGRRLADPAIYRDQPLEVQSLNQRYAAIGRELASFMARWEELEAAQTRAG